MIAITNSHFFRDNELIANQTILIKEGKIIAFTDGTILDGYRVVGAKQDYLLSSQLDLNEVFKFW